MRTKGILYTALEGGSPHRGGIPGNDFMPMGGDIQTPLPEPNLEYPMAIPAENLDYPQGGNLANWFHRVKGWAINFNVAYPAYDVTPPFVASGLSYMYELGIEDEFQAEANSGNGRGYALRGIGGDGDPLLLGVASLCHAEVFTEPVKPAYYFDPVSALWAPRIAFVWDGFGATTVTNLESELSPTLDTTEFTMLWGIYPMRFFVQTLTTQVRPDVFDVTVQPYEWWERRRQDGQEPLVERFTGRRVPGTDFKSFAD